MKILILVLFCAFSTLLLSCSDVNSGNGTNSNGNDDGNNNGNNGSSKTVTAANLNEFFDVFDLESIRNSVKFPCPAISQAQNSMVQRCEGVKSGYSVITTSNNLDSFIGMEDTVFRTTQNIERFNMSNAGRLYLNGVSIGIVETLNNEIITILKGYVNFSGEFAGTLSYENLRLTPNPGSSIINGRVMIGSFEITNAYFERFLRR